MDRQGLQDCAEATLAAMCRSGFDQAQASAGLTLLDELNLNHNEPSLLRSTEVRQLTLVGIVDGRRGSTTLGDFAPAAVADAVSRLHADTLSAPQDAANAVSAGQRADIVQGPQQGDADLLADKAAELLAFRERETPKMMIDEGAVSHRLRRTHTLTSEGSDLSTSIGCYEIGAFGTARDGARSSSFNYTGGSADELASRAAHEYFGIGAMLRDTERQIHTRPISGKFVGDVVLTPPAVADLLHWLQAQISDGPLIAGSSLYRDQVGHAIASPLLTLQSRFDASGVAAVSPDAFAAPPCTVLRAGTLQCLTPSFYASRKTGLPHVPVAAAGWELVAGDTPLARLCGGVTHGALVGRLSMGVPAPNGDFSGVIKNSFEIVDGQVDAALAEVMITGNMARMLLEVSGVSRERLDTGETRLPWLRIPGLYFS